MISATKCGRTVVFQPESTSSVHIETCLGILWKGGLLQMITISLQSIYYAFGIASIICGAFYKLGYELGKNAKK